MWTAQHRNKPNNIPSSMEQTCSSISTAPLHSAGCQTLSHWPLLAHKPCCCLLLTGCDVWHWLVPHQNHCPLKMNYGSKEIQQRHWGTKSCICENTKVIQKSFSWHTLRMKPILSIKSDTTPLTCHFKAAQPNLGYSKGKRDGKTYRRS